MGCDICTYQDQLYHNLRIAGKFSPVAGKDLFPNVLVQLRMRWSWERNVAFTATEAAIVIELDCHCGLLSCAGNELNWWQLVAIELVKFYPVDFRLQTANCFTRCFCRQGIHLSPTVSQPSLHHTLSVLSSAQAASSLPVGLNAKHTTGDLLTFSCRTNTAGEVAVSDLHSV